VTHRQCPSHRICVQVDNPHCIRLYAVYVTPKKVFIVTELVVGGELLEWCDHDPAHMCNTRPAKDT